LALGSSRLPSVSTLILLVLFVVQAFILVPTAAADYTPPPNTPGYVTVGSGGALVQSQSTALDPYDAVGAWNTWTSKSKLSIGSAGCGTTTSCIVGANIVPSFRSKGSATVRTPFILVALALAVAAMLSVPGVAVAQSGFGQMKLSSDQLEIGSGKVLRVSGEGYQNCASQTVTLSLLFRSTTATGYAPFTDAKRLSQQVVKLDAAGGFRASLAVPAMFPGWLGYVAMEGPCVTLAPRMFLAPVEAIVPLGSPLAKALGITETGAVVVVPAAQVRAFPIMVDDPVKDPYVHLSPMVLLGSGNVRCITGDARAAAIPSGDVVINATGCENAETVSVAVGAPATVLMHPTHVRPGYAVPVELVFPPPETGTAVTPQAPETGNGAAAPMPAARTAGDSLADVRVVLLAGGAAVLLSLPMVARAARRRHT